MMRNGYIHGNSELPWVEPNTRREDMTQQRKMCAEFYALLDVCRFLLYDNFLITPAYQLTAIRALPLSVVRKVKAMSTKLFDKNDFQVGVESVEWPGLILESSPAIRHSQTTARRSMKCAELVCWCASDGI